MNSYIETLRTWNKIAALYEEKFMDLDLYDHTYDFFSDAIKKEKPFILDAGCGPGNISRYILSKHPDFKIFGIDVAPNMVALATKNNPAAKFSVMDLRSIDQFQTTYDGIICGFGLPYLSEADVKKFIFDCHNLLHESGVLYLSFVAGDPKQSGFKTGTPGDRVYFYYHSAEKIRKQLAETGFEELKGFEVPYKTSDTEREIHSVIITRKRET